MPFYLKVLQTKECDPTPSPSIVFTFRFTIESIKELGGASLMRFPSSMSKGNPYFTMGNDEREMANIEVVMLLMLYIVIPPLDHPSKSL